MNRDQIPPGTVEKTHRFRKGTWAFKLKRLPSIIPLKYKYLYFVCRNIKSEGVEYLENFSPIVQLSTIFIELTMILSTNCHTKYVDCTIVFAQVNLKEDIYIEPTRGFGGAYVFSKVLRIIRGIYGILQSPQTLFDKLLVGLLEHGSIQ